VRISARVIINQYAKHSDISENRFEESAGFCEQSSSLSGEVEADDSSSEPICGNIYSIF
jgi:hypothetical protein